MKTPLQISFRKTLGTLLFNLHGRAEFLSREAVGKGPLIRVPFPGRPIVLVNSPAALEEILVKSAPSFQKSFDYRILSLLLGKGLLTTDGNSWRRDRTAIQERFKPSFLGQFKDPILQEVKHATGGLDGKMLDVVSWASRLTGKVITTKIFGKALSDEEMHLMVNLLNRAQRQLTLKIVVPDFMKAIGSATLLSPVFDRPFQKTKGALLESMTRRMNEVAVGDENDRSLIQLLRSVAGEKAQTEDEQKEWIVDQALTFFLAGYETTALAISWCIHALSLHPEMQDHLHDELLKQGEDSEFLLAVIHETMRMFPPIAMMGRENHEAVEISGFSFKAGTTFLISPYVLHHSPEFWKDPERFNPYRFLQADARNILRSKYYIPFGAGPRVCIGQGFAMMEIRSALAAFFSKYRVGPKDREAALSIKGIPQISFTPSRPIQVLCSSR